MIQHRIEEITNALTDYHFEMEAIMTRKIELARAEIEAWKQLVNILYADQPEKLSTYFRK